MTSLPRLVVPVGPTIPDWVPGNTGKPSASELNRLTAPRIMTPAANTSVPIVYGRDRQFGRPFFAIADNAGGFLYVGYLFSIGRIEGFEALFLDGVDVMDTSNGLLGRYGAKGAQVNLHLGDATQTPDSLCIEAVATLPSGNVYEDTLNGIAYVVIKVPKGASNNFPRLEAVIQGRRVYDPRLDSTAGGSGGQRENNPATWAYSTNPTLCFADFVTKQVGWSVIWSSIVEGANFNDEALAPGVKRRTIGLTLASPQTASAWVQGFRVYMGAYTPWENGAIRVVPDRADVNPSVSGFKNAIRAGNWAAHNVAYHFGKDDIVEGSLQLAHRTARNFPNVITIEYTDSSLELQWVTDRVTKSSAGVIAGLEKRRPSTISLPGVHDRSQATREAIERLNWFVNDLEGSFTAFDEGLQLQIGSIIAITHPIGLDVDLFRIIDAKEQDGRWSFNIAEYDPLAYSDTIVNDPNYQGPGSNVPVSVTPPAVQSLVADEELFTYPNKLVGSRVRATWTALPASYADHYVIEGWVGTQKVWQGSSLTNVAVTGPVEGLVGTTPVVYTVKVYAVLKGIVGDVAQVNTTIAGKTAPPLAVPSLAAARLDANTVALSWVEPAENDVKVYEVRKFVGASPTWAGGTLVERTKSRTCTAYYLALGSHTFMVKAIDSYDHESPTAATAALTISKPSTPENLTGFVVNGQVRLRWDANDNDEFVRKYRVSRGTSPEVVLAEVSDPRFTINDLQAGTYTFHVYAIDSAGRVCDTPANTNITVVVNADDLTLDQIAKQAAEELARIAGDANNAQQLVDGLAAEAQARSDEIEDRVSEVAQDLLDTAAALGTSITNEATLRQNGDNALASMVSSIVAGSGEQFDSKTIWYFDSTVESWTGTSVSASGGFLLVGTNSSTTPYVQSPALSFDSTVYRYVKARLKKYGTLTWVGKLQWITSGDTTWNDTKSKTVVEPNWDSNGIATVDFKDIDWPANVTGVRMYLFAGPTTSSNYYGHDFIAVGRPAPGASLAALQDEATARTTGDSALATSISTLASQVRGGYTGTDLNSITTGLLYQERVARATADGALASSLTALTARMDSAELDINAHGTAISSLQTSVTNLGTSLAVQSTALTSLASDIRSTRQSLALSFRAGALADWIITVGGTVEVTYPSSSGAMGGYALHVGDNAGNDMLWARYGQQLRFDAQKLYRMRYRYRRVSGSGSVYLGIAARDAADANYITTSNATGATLATQHYAVNAATPALGTWVEGTYYYKGRAAGSSTGTGTIDDPRTLAALTAFISPMLVANYNNAAGEVEYDFIILEDADAVGAANVNATAISSLDTRVTAAEGSLSSQSSALTALASRVGDTGDNLILKSIFEDGAIGYWTAGGPAAVGTISSHPSLSKALVFSGSVWPNLAPTACIPASPGDIFDMSADLNTQLMSGGSVALRMYWFDATGAALGGGSAFGTAGSRNAGLTGFVTISGAVTAPASAVYGRPTLVYITGSGNAFAVNLRTYRRPPGMVANTTAINGLTTRVDAAEGSISANSTSITALNTAVAGKASSTALSALTTRVDTAEGNIATASSSITKLNASLLAGGSNLIANSSGQNGTTGWTASTGTLTVVNGGGQPNYFNVSAIASSTTRTVSTSPRITAYPNRPYTFSADLYVNGAATGQFYIDMLFYDAGGTLLLDGSNAITTVRDAWDRVTVTTTAPENTATVACRLVAASATWSILGMTRAKLEQNATATPYSEEAATFVGASATSALDIRVTSAEGTINAQATQISTLSTSIGDTNATITSLASVVASAQVGNAIANPSFEDGLDHWTPIGSVTVVTSGARTGSRLIRMDSTSSLSAGVTSNDFISVKTGQTVKMSFYTGGYGTNPTAGSFCRINVRWFDANKSQTSYVASNCSTTTQTRWNQVNGSITVPSGAAYMKITITTNATSGAWAVEDVSVEPLTDLLATALATVGVTLDVNGYVTGWSATNDGSTGTFKVAADKFAVVSPSGSGARTEFSGGNWRVYDSAGTLRVRLGVW